MIALQPPTPGEAARIATALRDAYEHLRALPVRNAYYHAGVPGSIEAIARQRVLAAAAALVSAYQEAVDLGALP